ncbi:hypothetical protein HDU76_011728, partial [Blyttiomyces sp. JEL0837]
DRINLDLRVSMVREQNTESRPYVFEVRSPTETFTLQALSEFDCKEWITKIQAAISKAIYRGDDNPEDHVHENDHYPPFVRKLREIPGNDSCADCGGKKDVVWASLNHGLLLCIGCSGLHRSLGTHVSKVKSLVLDRWTTESQEIMLSLGNQTVNKLLEYHGDLVARMKPKPDSDRGTREAFVQAKYVSRQFLKKWGDRDSSEENVDSAMGLIPQHVKNAIRDNDLSQVLWPLLIGFDVQNTDVYQKTFLHYCSQQGRLAIAEFLLIWGAD